MRPDMKEKLTWRGRKNCMSARYNALWRDDLHTTYVSEPRRSSFTIVAVVDVGDQSGHQDRSSNQDKICEEIYTWNIRIHIMRN